MYSLGKYGQAYLESLKENRPQLFQTLKANGELQASAIAVDERARAQFESLLSSLKQEHPLPKEPAARLAALSGLENQANELVMAEVLVKDEETEAAESEGYVDQAPEKPAVPQLRRPTSSLATE